MANSLYQLSYRGIPMDQNKSHSVHPKKQFSSKPF
jgi:hypothetical protein